MWLGICHHQDKEIHKSGSLVLDAMQLYPSDMKIVLTFSLEIAFSFSFSEVYFCKTGMAF